MQYIPWPHPHCTHTHIGSRSAISVKSLGPGVSSSSSISNAPSRESNMVCWKIHQWGWCDWLIDWLVGWLTWLIDWWSKNYKWLICWKSKVGRDDFQALFVWSVFYVDGKPWSPSTKKEMRLRSPTRVMQRSRSMWSRWKPWNLTKPMRLGMKNTGEKRGAGPAKFTGSIVQLPEANHFKSILSRGLPVHFHVRPKLGSSPVGSEDFRCKLAKYRLGSGLHTYI